MQDTAPFSQSPDGGTLVCGDGPELLVYDALDGRPRWKAFCDGILVAVGASNTEVITLDTEGTFTRWRGADGAKQDSFEVPGGQSISVFSDGMVLVRTPESLLVAGRTGVVGQIPYASASAAVFGPNTQSIGVGYEDGTFRAVDATSGVTWGEVKIDGGVRSVAWSARGNWVVAGGSGLTVVSGDGKSALGSIGGVQAPLHHLSVAEEGAIAAAVMGHNQVALFDLVTYRAAGTVDFRRAVGGVGFGSAGQLGVGLDDGDAARIDVFSGKSHRTEPHQGRGRNSFNLDNNLNADVLRGATATSKAGGAPIAKYVGAPEEGGYLWTCLGIFVATNLLCLGCAGCSGIAYYMGIF